MSASSPNSYESSSRSAWAGGVSVFAGTVLLTVGLFQFFEGLSAVLSDNLYVNTRNYVFQFDITTWGWIHLVLGAIAVAVGLSILMGQAWAFLFGIVIASLSALTNFMFIPWYPVWAVIIIAFDIAVIWALCVRLGES
jgi:hypothetical protein